jgi:hypothetical protein
MVPHFSRCQCGHTINDLGIHLLHCTCKSECTIAHDTLWNIVATIMSKSGVHKQREVSHLFPCHTWKWMDIVISKDGFWTLVDVVIVNLTCIDLVQHALMTIMHASIVVAQDKARSYTKQAPRDDFIPLAIETYDCLHPRFDFFLTSCVHVTIVCINKPPWYLWCLYLIISNECR